MPNPILIFPIQKQYTKQDKPSGLTAVRVGQHLHVMTPVPRFHRPLRKRKEAFSLVSIVFAYLETMPFVHELNRAG